MNKQIEDNTIIVSLKIYYWLFFLILLALSFYILYRYVSGAYINIRYPLSMYWYEDESLYQLQRIFSGSSFYERPSVSHTPFMYGPIYYYLSAGVSFFTGISLFPLRLTSFLSNIATLILIYSYVLLSTRSKLSSLVSVSFYAGFYSFTKMWFDMARIDSITILLIVSVIYIIQFHQSARSLFFASFLLFLACLSKQTALVIFLSVIIFYYSKKNIVRFFCISFICIYIIGIAVFRVLFGEWFFYYYFILPFKHGLEFQGFAVFIYYDLVLSLLFALPAIILYGRNLFLKYFFPLFAAGLYSLISRANIGGDVNSSLLLYSVVALVVGDMIFTSKMRVISRSANRRVVIREVFIMFMIMIQGVWYISDHSLSLYYFNQEKKREEPKKIVEYLQGIKGEVYMSNHRDLIRATGREAYVHLDALGEILGDRGYRGPTKEGLEIRELFIKKISNQEFEILIMDKDRMREKKFNPVFFEMNKYYKKTDTFFSLGDNDYYVYAPRL